MNAERLHLLIVEDEEAHVEAIRRAFEKADANVEIRAVGTLREFRAAVADRLPDLVLIDLNLPDGKAMEVMTFTSETAPFPILVMTAFGNQEIVVKVMKAGALDYVIKSPEAFAAMPQTMERAFREWKLLQKHKQTKEALRESEVRYRRLFEDAQDGMALAEAETGRLADCNRALCRMVEREQAELVGQFQSVLHPPQENTQGGVSSTFRQHQTDARKVLESRLLSRSGKLLPVEIMASRVQMNGRDYMLGIFRDITERRRVEESHARLATAVEQAAETIMITDTDGTILYVNPAFDKTSGYTREEAIGQNPRFLKSDKQNAEFYRRLWAALVAGEVWSGRMINKRKDGTLYEEDASISPMRDAAGTIVSYVAVKRDVTREVQLETQLHQAQKMEAVGRLAGGVAHDFNNLLMGIMGYAELCRGRIDPGHPIREWLDEITRDAERSADITRQLLAFARKQTIAPKILDLNDAVAGMLKLLRRLIGEDINLAWLPGTDLRPVRLDPSQVDQVLANLCVNARDAIAGVGKITLETGNTTLDAEYCARHADAIPGAYVFLSVSDDGCGMDRETMAQIFEPFFTTKGLGKGTGLGLATVYGIVKQNSGFIYVYSEPGQGTTFRIHLPQVAAGAVAATATSKAAVPRGRGETILLVEDEKSLRVTCGLFLEALDYKVLLAETPGEALKMVDRHPGDIHLLLTDVVMPGMDGRQLSKRISAVKPGVKVLFMSGYTADVIAQRGVLEQNTAFIGKPFKRDDLARKVRDVLEAHEPASQEAATTEHVARQAAAKTGTP
ncbi:MAG: hypothetical protein A3K19_12095 [Lentisphaerae bacterium RIFOXYB12_FULL_65_16]|nr:MAG: hypothetical protein A3K18_14490 [Lentisphaerae bacterium RIFOXYA12_64_32]OGV86218.1 MAG: hypothetical protein A3K19_12095 [Lentisphaerae bacterium RIFOXYB12_FULL_65_16]